MGMGSPRPHKHYLRSNETEEELVGADYSSFESQGLCQINVDNWVKDQKKKAPAGNLKRILLKLRKDGRFYHALQDRQDFLVISTPSKIKLTQIVL
ncbi:hypothetical protein DM860_014725 [Cuscuta australis]|uniref:Uncharacterized protein n=1 Tax=Cuscuta australis TaxID=267555 RepID=A0A328DHI4_9ASTE|nr:hypothetical protein DM860_014725 [Cuscuta australis]